MPEYIRPKQKKHRKKQKDEKLMPEYAKTINTHKYHAIYSAIWVDNDICVYFGYSYLLQRPLAPHGRTSPDSVTGRPISSASTFPPNLVVNTVFSI